MEEVIIVDQFDRENGFMEKLKAHEQGFLHRAISVCLFDKKGRWLLQKRSVKKYHSPGLIANSCCSHPRPFESTHAAAARRLREELGISCPLTFCFSFVYKEPVGFGLIEHEYDHVYVGVCDTLLEHNVDEVDTTFFMEETEIEKLLVDSPHIFAAWFSFVYRNVLKFR